MWRLSHSAPTHSPQTLHVFFLSSPFFLSFVCLPAFLSLSLCLHPDHSSTSFSLSACHTLSPTTLCSSWPKPFVGSCELACLSACHCRVRWRSPSHMSYLQKMNLEHPDVRGPGTQRQRREQVDNHGMTMLCCRQRDIHNWWSSFAALSHWWAPIVQHVGTWTSGQWTCAPNNSPWKRKENERGKTERWGDPMTFWIHRFEWKH